MANIEQSYHYNVVRRAIDLIDGSWGKGPLSRQELAQKTTNRWRNR
ncbi:MAG: hypothetical protein GDA40_04710 [Rhodobacteraceae bacterium]|nr:hypothetical protein [Paracoccaceae bacterium]